MKNWQFWLLIFFLSGISFQLDYIGKQTHEVFTQNALDDKEARPGRLFPYHS